MRFLNVLIFGKPYDLYTNIYIIYKIPLLYMSNKLQLKQHFAGSAILHYGQCLSSIGIFTNKYTPYFTFQKHPNYISLKNKNNKIIKKTMYSVQLIHMENKIKRIFIFIFNCVILWQFIYFMKYKFSFLLTRKSNNLNSFKAFAPIIL